ncbi:MAG: ATP-dependent helicase [Clostridium sp.]|nr:ATP-dependent helicase [Clostridium sp.]
MEFSKAQRAAIEHDKGPMLVLAGPGSGKTFVITQRTKYLIEQHGVDPRTILVITFTKAAAEEMKGRFAHICDVQGVTFGTFHAVFFNILRYAYGFRGDNILREEMKYQIVQEIIRKMEISVEDEKELIENLISEISFVKGSGINIENYFSLNCSDVSFTTVYQEYEQKLRSLNKIDFDDMMIYCLELFQQRKDILGMWQKRYQYIMVDEAQDSNIMQYEITKLLAGDTKNLFLVGDDDQSLYRFRGAKPEILLNFDKDFPTTKQVVLEYNYRSQQKIVEAALRVVENNSHRFEKQIQAVRKPTHDVAVCCYPTSKEENQAIVRDVLELSKQGVDLNEIAILFRTNKQPRSLLGLFMSYNIPFRMKDIMPNIFEHWIAKNIVAYIKMAQGNLDRGLFLEVMNRPKRYLSRDSLKDSVVNFGQLRDFYKEKPYMVERIFKLEYDLKMLQSMAPYAAIQYIRKGMDYDSYIKEYAEFRNVKPDEFFEVLDELTEGAKEFKTYEEWFSYMQDYEENLRDQLRKREEKKNPSVSFMTFHGCKGLEFKHVYILDANEDITPHRKAVNAADMEEERRMFYVAMTRAKDNLTICYVKERYEKELKCSRFVGELLMNKVAMKENARVKHNTYGTGTIVKVEDGKCTIKFDKHPVPKVLSVEFCVQNQILQVIEE